MSVPREVSLVVAAEEAEAVRASSAALLQLTARLNGTNVSSKRTEFSAASPLVDSGALPFVSAEDGVGFMDLLREIVNHYAPRKDQSTGDSVGGNDVTEQQRVMALRHVMFEIQPELLSTVLSILHAPHMMAENDDVCGLFCGALLFLQSVLFACCVPWDQHVSRNSNEANTHTLYPIESAELSAMIGDLLERMDTVVILTDLMYDEFPFSVRQLAVQLLFALLLRGGSTVHPTATTYVREALSSPDRLSILLSVVSSSPVTSDLQQKQQPQQQRHMSQELSRDTHMSGTYNPSHVASESDVLSLRLHAAACLRELANSHFVSLANFTVLDMLQQLMTTEQNGDLRALAIETINIVVMQNKALFWISVPFKKELVAACVTQMEKNQSDDALRATLSLIETLILKDTTGEFEEDSSADNLYSPMVCEMLLSLFADRALASLIGKVAKGRSSGAVWDCVPFFQTPYKEPQQQSGRGEEKQIQPLEQKHNRATTCCVVSQTPVLAARCLRLLIQYAPHDRNGGFYLLQHISSSARLLEVTMRLAEQREALRVKSTKNKANCMDELKLVLSVELSVIIGLGLAQDPRARRVLVSEFIAYPSEARQVRQALISNLNLVSLSYFGSGLIDFRIKDVTGAILNMLEAVSWDTPNHPSRAAVHDLFASQEARLSAADKTTGLACFHKDNTKTGCVQDVNKVQSGSMDMSHVSAVSCHQRLTFIVLSYAIHYTFKFACDESLTSMGANAMTSHAMRGPLSKTSHKKKISRDTACDPARYYGSFLIDTGNDFSRTGSPPPKQETKSQQREPLLSPVPRDPQNLHERIMSPSRPHWFYLADGALLAMEKKKPQTQSKQGDRDDSMITEKDTELFQQYQRGLQLFIDLAQFYSEQPTSVALAKRTVVYEATREGLFRRQGQRKTQETLLQILGEESERGGRKMKENNFSSRIPLRRDNIGVIGSNTRFWSIEELQEKDLFSFYIPYKQLTLVALRQVRRQAEQHAHRMKKLFAITPQSAKARRWLLHDAVINILPGIIHNLSQIIQWFDMYGEDTVKLPLLIFFRDDEQQRQERKHLQEQEQQQQWNRDKPEDHLDDGQAPKLVEPKETSLPSPDDVALHAGNLIPLVQQIAFYLQRRQGEMPQKDHTTHPLQQQQMNHLSNNLLNTGDVFQQPCSAPSGDSAHSPWHGEKQLGQKKSTLLNDIEREMSRLQAMEFGDERSAGFLLSDVAASPYEELQQQRLGESKDLDEGRDIELSEKEDDFDEMKDF